MSCILDFTFVKIIPTVEITKNIDDNIETLELVDEYDEDFEFLNIPFFAESYNDADDDMLDKLDQDNYSCDECYSKTELYYWRKAYGVHAYITDNFLKPDENDNPKDNQQQNQSSNQQNEADKNNYLF